MEPKGSSFMKDVKDTALLQSEELHQGSFHLTKKEKYSATMDTSSPKLFIILSDEKNQYCLYRICDPGKMDKSSIPPNLGKPLLEMDKSTYPRHMSFVAVDKRIYMVGGLDFDFDDIRGFHSSASKKMFICDTTSNTISPGPSLVSGKIQPVLITLGSKIYALTSIFYYCSGLAPATCQTFPGLEVFDIENPHHGWSALPAPPVRFRADRGPCMVKAYAAVGGNPTCSSSVIFITISNYRGTFAYDVDNKVWDNVSKFNLPFSGYAMPMPSSPNLPCAPWLCFALSKKTRGRFSAFRFRYNANRRKLKVDEIEISTTHFPWELPPLLYSVWPLTALDRFGRVYSIQVGTASPDGSDDRNANRYVKVDVATICTIKPRTRSHVRNKEDEENNYLNGERPSKRSRTTKLIRNNDIKDAGEFMMSHIWSSTFLGGPVVDLPEITSAAFVA